MSAFLAIKLLTFVAILVCAAVLDVRSRRIPNRLTVPALLLGLGFAVVEGELGAAGLGAALALAVSLPLFALGAFGGGDGKLLMAIGAFLGPLGLLNAALYAGVLGGVLAIVQATRRGVILPLLYRAWNLVLFGITLGRLGERSELGAAGSVTIPYGLALGGGALVAWFLPILDGGLLS